MTFLRPRRSASGNTRLPFVGLTAAVTLAVLVVSVTSGASAYYTAPGQGSGSASLGTLLPPTNILVPATSSGAVHLSWTASAGALAPTGYYATRTETGTAATAPACGTSPTSTVATVSCDDLSVMSGGYTYTVTAVYRGWTAKSAPSAGVVVSNPTKLAFQAQPSNATSGTVFASQPSVAIQNAAGQTVTTSSRAVTLAITGSPAGANLTCAQNPLTAVSGIATFTGCQVDKAGTYTLTATATGLTAATSSNVTIAAGPATKLGFTTQPTSSTGGTAFPTQPVVTVLDAFGNTVTTSNAPVNLSITSSTVATLRCTSANPLTATSGVASFAGCQIDKTGTFTLTAVSGSLISAASAALTISVGTAKKLSFTQPTTSFSATSQTTFPSANQPVVTVQDAGGNVLPGSAATISLGLTTPAGATLACAQNLLTAVSGIATFTGCQIDKAGTYTLTATATGLTAATSSNITVTAGPATKLLFTTQPSNGTGGTAFPGQPVVTVLDAFGNAVTTSNVPVNLSIAPPGGATLTCTTNPLTAASGVAAFTGCNIDKPGTYTLTAVSGSWTAVSNSLTIVVGSEAKLAIAFPTSTATSQIAFPNQPVVTAQDAGGNTVTNSTATVTLSLTNASGAALSACASTRTAGVTTFTGCQIDKVGAYTLTATVSGPITATSNTVTISAGAAYKLAFTGSFPAGSYKKNTVFGSQPVVTVQDAFGNTAAVAVSVTLSVTAGQGGSLSCTTNPLTSAAGVANFGNCQIITSQGSGNKETGPYTLNAVAPGLAAAIPTTVTIT
ncbi:hypothetical protein E3O19_12760 [Cryobacterium algoritolerans]|uniref:Fibronectin type-III domain-containing protein n=1 Tax=Cryobacterium algoritolerans TaxID=1259184 RepID=A0A4R8WRU5_9MICO|nr:hypothetical protein [Cryobacterium algoritolerans]TFC13062.1 hypothetical protein E3O19_12760 [Cryobacterium algoritolerans]